MADTIRVDATNISDGPRMFNGVPPVAVPAGQSVHDVEIIPAELSSMKATGWFKIDGDAARDKPDYERDGLKNVDISKPATSKDVLLVIAAYEGAEVSDDATKAELIKAIEAKRKG